MKLGLFNINMGRSARPNALAEAAAAAEEAGFESVWAGEHVDPPRPAGAAVTDGAPGPGPRSVHRR